MGECVQSSNACSSGWVFSHSFSLPGVTRGCVSHSRANGSFLAGSSGCKTEALHLNRAKLSFITSAIVGIR